MDSLFCTDIERNHKTERLIEDFRQCFLEQFSASIYIKKG